MHGRAAVQFVETMLVREEHTDTCHHVIMTLRCAAAGVSGLLWPVTAPSQRCMSPFVSEESDGMVSFALTKANLFMLSYLFNRYKSLCSSLL